MNKKHFYLYIDDSGSRFPDSAEVADRRDEMDCFALGGILIALNDKVYVKEKYIAFCEKWNISYPLHSTKIRGMRGDFSWLNDSGKKYKDFMEDLQKLLVEIPVIGFAAVIHRPGYNERYKEKYGENRWWMCKTAYSILLERVTKYVVSQGGTFEVCFEEVGTKENNAIIEYTKKLKVEGHPFSKETSNKYESLSCEVFKNTILGDARRKKKSNLFIQLADLYLYPMVKRKYDPFYLPWLVLFKNKKIIDSIVSEENCALLGIKYSCFDVRSTVNRQNPE